MVGLKLLIVIEIIGGEEVIVVFKLVGFVFFFSFLLCFVYLILIKF